jgi:hypothetical protein
MRIFLFTRKTLNLTLSIILLILSLTGAAFSQATAVTTNQFVPFAQTVLVPCANGGAGETVLVSGTLHLQEHVTINNNRASLKIHAQPQGATGVGQITGDIYHGTGVTQEQDSIALTNGAFEFTFINNFRLIGPGPDNNMQTHQTIHLTINANGVVTALVGNINIDCN